MVKVVLASIALAGSAVAGSVGSAHVVNKCNYEVTLCNVPSDGGGYTQQDKTLSPGESWAQPWTQLSNGNGWSIKLSKTSSLEKILQYEYTFHNDGIIWYDLSCVDGNPWDQDWEITASSTTCSPKQQAYRYSTDDAYGMQACADDVDITVSLCTGVSADNGTNTGSGHSAPSYASPTTSAPGAQWTSTSTSSPAPAVYSATPAAYSYNPAAYSSTSTSVPAPYGYGIQPTPTTLSTSATTSASLTTEVETFDGVAVTITEVETAYVTAVVTAYEKRDVPPSRRARRHEHQHVRGQQHAHAHRHEN